jgi:hypothetical protein
MTISGARKIGNTFAPKAGDGTPRIESASTKRGDGYAGRRGKRNQRRRSSGGPMEKKPLSPEQRERKRAYLKAWREKHQERLHAYNKTWHGEHREQRLAYHKRWHEENRERVLARQKRHYQENQDRIKEERRKRYRERKELKRRAAEPETATRTLSPPLSLS